DAVRRYDPADERHASFSTFALHRLRHAVTDTRRSVDHWPVHVRRREREGRYEHPLPGLVRMQPEFDRAEEEPEEPDDRLGTLLDAAGPHVQRFVGLCCELQYEPIDIASRLGMSAELCGMVIHRWLPEHLKS